MKFTKMHGIGNDYIYFNCFEETVDNPEELSIRLSDRHFGVGGDGIVLIMPSDKADFRMRMFNADGSEGKMCGNAIRCVARYLSERIGGFYDRMTIETLSGIKHLTINRAGIGEFDSVSVEMGRAILEGHNIPVAAEGLIREYPLTVGRKTWTITAVSMGNPHAVVFIPYARRLNLPKIGPQFENHPFFPDRVNTEFVHQISTRELEMRVWERGSGETLACGTGACASVVAACITGRCAFDSPVTVHLRGGDLSVTCRSDLTVEMTGGAEFVFDGTCTYPL